MRFIVSGGSSLPDVMDRRLRASDLPQPTTNAAADRSVRDVAHARQRALMRVSGFADAGAGDPAGAVAADGGAATAGSFFTGNMMQAVTAGVVTIVAGTFVMRMIDRLTRGGR